MKNLQQISFFGRPVWVVIFLLFAGACTPENNRPAEQITIVPKEIPAEKQATSEAETPQKLEEPTLPEPAKKTIKQTDNQFINLNKKQNLAEVLNELAKQPAVRTFLPDKEQLITFPEGTKLRIPARSLVYADGRPVTEEVHLEVREFYSKTDMILNGLSTVSDGKLLESGGMLHIEAFAGGEKLQVKTGKSIGITFASRNSRPMSLFYGENKEENAVVNWKLAPEEENWVLSSVVLARGINPVSKQNFFGTFPCRYRVKYIQLLVGRETSSTNRYILHDLPDSPVIANNDSLITRLAEHHQKDFGTFILDFFKMKHSTAKMRAGDHFIFSFYDTNVVLSEAAATKCREDREKERLVTERNYAAAQRKFEAAQPSLKESVFSSAKLGWINCDRFTYSGKRLCKVKVKKRRKNTNISLIFRDINAVMQPKKTTDEYVIFSGIPVGSKVTVCALETKKGKLFAALDRKIVRKRSRFIPKYRLVPADSLRSLLTALN